MGDTERMGSRAITLTLVLVAMLVAPLLLARCNREAGSTDLAVRALLVTPAPTRGGPEARLVAGGVTTSLGDMEGMTLAARLQAVREACASLPSLETGPLGRMAPDDARALQTLLDGLPYRDVVQRIAWAEPIIGADSHFQEILISGGQGIGVFRCTDEIAAAIGWSLVGSEASDWTAEIAACRVWGASCTSALFDRLRVRCHDVDACASRMRWSEIDGLLALLDQPQVGTDWTDPFGGTNPAARDLAERISQAKLAQNPG